MNDSAIPALPRMQDVDVHNKRVLVRVDYNIGSHADGSLLDDHRIAATIPTIRHLTARGARVALLTHRGRPGGRVMPSLSTKPMASVLAEMLEHKVTFVPDCVGRMAASAIDGLQPGEVALLENTRFHLGEQMNQQPFVKEMAALGDVFINDAFATIHRAHASTSGLAAAMPVRGIGLLMQQELEWVERLRERATPPFTAIVGGNTVGNKVELIRHLLDKADTIMLGGAVANTFIAARDLGIGQSMLAPEWVETARDLLTEAGVVGCRLHIPQDVWVVNANTPDETPRACPVEKIGPQDSVIDIGPGTVSTWQRLIDDAGSVLLTGSLGRTELANGRAGSLGLAQALSSRGIFSLVAGTGMMPALSQAGLRERLPAVSTGGSALSLALMGKPMPCLNLMRGLPPPAWHGTERRRGDR